MNRTIVYIDGFNFYYGAVRGTPYRWLNIAEMCRMLLPKNDISDIKYYTARVKPRSTDPDQANRQQAYIRALLTEPSVSVVYGHFLSHSVTMPLASPTGRKKFARVIKTEEKGSDVNLATHLVHDAHLDRFDTAVVISNDSDLLEPIRLVREDLGKRVGILNPQQRPSRVLHANTDFFKQIRAGVLKASQFPALLSDQHGQIHKPIDW
ncbi:MAG: NYN domain-containing protein [Mariprofundaceae bacterium]|nr:NYN domain-containing protein [Mariprofundaceae bacterium]